VPDQVWLGPTYEFRSGQWSLSAGIPADGGRLQWLLRQVGVGEQDVSHSFILEPHATRDDLAAVLDDLPAAVKSDLIDQVDSQTDPRLLSSETEATDGLA